MEKNTIRLYGNKAFGVEVSKYGLDHGYLDYLTLSKIIGDCILNNNIISETMFSDWEVLSGDCNEDIYQFYIISDAGAQLLSELTDEIVYYNSNLDLYLWGVTHFGTSWDYVLTDVKLTTEGNV
jgi:hypothetical protein|nr:MAG TPA: hypothetical protein [Herelleviridae sp.]